MDQYAEKLSYAKMQAEQNMCGTACPPPQAPYSTECCEPKAEREPTVERLRRINRQSNIEENRRYRVIDILSRHPEFEEFLEVLRSGLV
jgi:hypothetical protein